MEMHEEDETCTSVDTTIKQQPSSSIVGKVITPEEGTLVAIQYVPKLYQGMHMFSFSIISAHLMEDCGNMPLHDQGLKNIDDL